MDRWTGSIALPDRAPRRSARTAHTVGRLAQPHDLEGFLLSGDDPRGMDGIPVPHAIALLEYGEDAPDGSYPSDLVPYHGALWLTRQCLNRHLLVIGKPGAHKTTSMVLPIALGGIADPEALVVVLSAKGDLTPWVLEAARRHKRTVYYVDPTDPEHSLRWSGMASVETQGDADLLAASIVNLVERGRYETGFFHQRGTGLLAEALAAGAQNRNSDLTLARIAHAFGSPSSLLDLAVEYRLTNLEEFVRPLIEHYSSNEGTTIDTVAAALKEFDAPDVAKVMSGNDLHLETIADAPGVLLINLPETESDRLKPFATLLVTALIQALYRRAAAEPSQRLPRPALIVLDEFASALGRMPSIPKYLSTVRSRNISVVAAVQSTSQISATYGDSAPTLMTAFSSFAALAPLESSDARWLSEMCGYTITDTAYSRPDNRVVYDSSERPLILATEAQEACYDARHGAPALLCLANLPPFYAYLEPIFRHPDYRDFASGLIDGAVNTRALLPVRDGVGSPTAPARERKSRHHRRCPLCRNPSPCLSDTTGWSLKRMRARRDDLVSRLMRSDCTAYEAEWWRAFLRENDGDPDQVIYLLECMQMTGVTLGDLHKAFLSGNSESPLATLYFAIYRRLKAENETKTATR